MARLEEQEKSKKQDKERKHMENKAPNAAKKLEKQERKIDCLYMPEIKVILYKVYNKTMSGSKLKKADYVRALENEFSANIEKYESFVSLLESTNSN